MHDLTLLQRYSDVGSSYSSVVVSFLFAPFIIIKTDLCDISFYFNTDRLCDGCCRSFYFNKLHISCKLYYLRLLSKWQWLLSTAPAVFNEVVPDIIVTSLNVRTKHYFSELIDVKAYRLTAIIWIKSLPRPVSFLLQLVRWTQVLNRRSHELLPVVYITPPMI